MWKKWKAKKLSFTWKVWWAGWGILCPHPIFLFDQPKRSSIHLIASSSHMDSRSLPFPWRSQRHFLKLFWPWNRLLGYDRNRSSPLPLKDFSFLHSLHWRYLRLCKKLGINFPRMGIPLPFLEAHLSWCQANYLESLQIVLPNKCCTLLASTQP